jgi:hypothetical protein
MSDPSVPDRPQADEGQSETVGAPFRDAEAPTRGKTPFVWVALVVLVALAVGAMVAALGFGLLD